MENKILLHGATNSNSTNYGDYIYADMVYQYFKNKGYKVKFYQPSNFFVKFLTNYNDNSFKTNECNYIIYIPGGYFGEGHNASLKENLYQFYRFMPIGLWGTFFKKKILVLGIGAFPLKNFFMRNSVKRICNYADLVTVRDDNSFNCLKNLCKNDNIKNAGDLILTYDIKNNLNKTNQIKKIINNKGNKKLFLIHYNHDKIALNKFSKALKLLNNLKDEYNFVVIYDTILENEKSMFIEFQKEFTNCELYSYSDPYELSCLINISDVILTCKLHVGVVGCLLNKSVISVACHYEKTRRFYEQISESERCISLYESSIEDIANLISTYKNKNINIPKYVIDNSFLTWKYLEEKNL